MPDITSQFKLSNVGLYTNLLLRNDVSTIDKFGLNPLVTTATDPEDVWEGGGIYPFSNTADIVSVSSSNAGDTGQLSVQGLDANGRLVNQIVTLNGQTRVALTTPLWRVFRMENDGTSNFLGTVYCYSGTTNTAGVPSGGSVTKAIIDNGNNQTLMAIYTIPKGYVGFLFRGELGIEYGASPGAGTNFARVQYQSRRLGKVFKVKKDVTLVSSGASSHQDVRSFPDIIPALTDIKITVKQVSDDLGVWATFDIMLFAENTFPAAYLSKIGQPFTTGL